CYRDWSSDVCSSDLLVTVLGLSSFAAASASSTAPTANCASVGVGAIGPAVMTLQHAVGVAADGDYGLQTAKAVATWQRKHHVKRSEERRVGKGGKEW